MNVFVDIPSFSATTSLCPCHNASVSSRVPKLEDTRVLVFVKCCKMYLSITPINFFLNYRMYLLKLPPLFLCHNHPVSLPGSSRVPKLEDTSCPSICLSCEMYLYLTQNIFPEQIEFCFSATTTGVLATVPLCPAVSQN